MTFFVIHSNELRDIGNFKSFSQQYHFGKGLKLFGDRGHEASASELEQLHHQKCLHPISVNEMTRNEE